MKSSPGFTLIQLLITLSVFSSLVMIAVPNFYDVMSRNQADSVANQLLSSLNYARYMALSNGVTIIWCGSHDHQHCTADWNRGQIIFVDQDGTHQVNQENKLLRIIDALSNDSQLIWQGFQGENYLKITPYNMAMTLDGRFIYKNANNNPRYQREVIINRMGRGRLEL